MYIILSTRTGERSYSYLRLGEIDDASAKFIHDNLEIAFSFFIFLFASFVRLVRRRYRFLWR